MTRTAFNVDTETTKERVWSTISPASADRLVRVAKRYGAERATVVSEPDATCDKWRVRVVCTDQVCEQVHRVWRDADE